jgi:hypothetical protein
MDACKARPECVTAAGQQLRKTTGSSRCWQHCSTQVRRLSTVVIEVGLHEGARWNWAAMQNGLISPWQQHENSASGAQRRTTGACQHLKIR